MSRVFDAVDDYLPYAGGVVQGTPFTISAWGKSDATDAVTRTLVSIGSNAATDQYLALQRYSASAYVYSKNGATVGEINVTGLTANNWHHQAFVSSGNASRYAYRDGTTKSTENTTSVAPNAHNLTRIGGRAQSGGTPNDLWDGKLAHVAIWNIALTDAQIVALSRGADPRDIAPDNLISYWPLAGTASPEPDVKSGFDMTVNGATADTGDNPTMWPQGTLPIYVTAGTLATSTDSTAPFTITPTLPAHATDDILIVACMHSSGANLTIDAGWNEIITPINNANESVGYWWKRATSASETNPTITASATMGTVGAYATAFVVKNCVLTGTPFEDATGNGTPTLSTTPATATITTTGADRLAFLIGLLDDDNTVSSGWPPSGYSIVTNQSTTTGNDHRVLAAERYVAAAGDVAGGNIATMSASDYWHVLHLAFLPRPLTDTTPPVPNITVGPSRTKLSAVATFDSSDITVQVDEACQAWKVKVVPATNSIHTAGTQIESGGSVAANGTINVNITDDELSTASPGDGAKIVKFFFQDNAGNWST